MNPFRLDVLGLTILLSAPVIAMGSTGGLKADEAAVRFLICWAAVTLGVWMLKSYLDGLKAEADKMARIKAELDALTAEAEEAAENVAAKGLRDPLREPVSDQKSIGSGADGEERPGSGR